MNKKFLMVLGLSMLLVQSAFALTIDASSENDTFYGYRDSFGARPTVSASFGKPLFGKKDYGIVLTVRYFDEFAGREGAERVETAFFELDEGSLVRNEKELYFVDDEHSVLVANKKFYGWKPVDEVKFLGKMTKNPSSLTVDVSLQINE